MPHAFNRGAAEDSGVQPPWKAAAPRSGSLPPAQSWKFMTQCFLCGFCSVRAVVAPHLSQQSRAMNLPEYIRQRHMISVMVNKPGQSWI